ncbi:hypothetical protein EX30DRAFT_306985 [Ascodesmis nigricans]|uniref:Integral membrane protein n=1 Tax=Ascodesmis nigricans TaxID=341454 RepID=A0A4S2MW65_9PEZI|nr:hypothetical protein EX30DRAFT_306985 [Ascodesmis nigricans]
MGRAARFACIAAPMVCTIASLICVLLLLLAGTNDKLSGLDGVYITRVTSEYLKALEKLDNALGNNLPDLGSGFSDVDLRNADLEDFYSSYLWSYCYGDVDNSGSSQSYKTQDCSKTSIKYTFDLEGIINEDADSDKDKIKFPENVQKVQKGVAAVSKAMITSYILGFAATAITAVVGWFGLLSRWGSCVTTLFADVAFFFLLIASACATFLTYSLHGAFNKAFDEFGVDAKVGTKWMEITWIATAFSLGAAVFWLFSTCCCSGKKQSVMGEKEPKKPKGAAVGKSGAYSYERVASPYMGVNDSQGQGVQMQTYGNAATSPYGVAPAYEPMRHQQV